MRLATMPGRGKSGLCVLDRRHALPGRHSGDQVRKVKTTAAPSFSCFRPRRRRTQRRAAAYAHANAITVTWLTAMITRLAAMLTRRTTMITKRAAALPAHANASLRTHPSRVPHPPTRRRCQASEPAAADVHAWADHYLFSDYFCSDRTLLCVRVCVRVCACLCGRVCACGRVAS